jgi:hypothetical protein
MAVFGNWRTGLRNTPFPTIDGPNSINSSLIQVELAIHAGHDRNHAPALCVVPSMKSTATNMAIGLAMVAAGVALMAVALTL